MRDFERPGTKPQIARNPVGKLHLYSRRLLEQEQELLGIPSNSVNSAEELRSAVRSPRGNEQLRSDRAELLVATSSRTRV